MKRKAYSTFEWIDIKNSSLKEIKEITHFSDVEINLLDDSFEHGHLPKIEKVEGYTFIILRAYSPDENKTITTVGELSNKIAFFISDKKLLTLHRADFGFLNTVSTTTKSSETLMLEIIHQMLLTYEEPIQRQSDKMDTFERDIFLKHVPNLSIESLYFLKAEARITKKILLLTQHVLNLMTVKSVNLSNLQNLQDITVKDILLCDEVIEDANNLLNSYLSITAQKSNDVMKLLTVFSAFFLPLTFIVGLYGMNFKNMPELQTEYGYFVTLGVMLTIAIGIFIGFKRSKIL